MISLKIKAIVVLGLIVVLFFGGWYVKKQWFDDGSVFTTATMSCDSITRIAAAGGDLRMYECTPRSAPNMLCVFIAGSEKAGLDCFRKDGYVAADKTLP